MQDKLNGKAEEHALIPKEKNGVTEAYSASKLNQNSSSLVRAGKFASFLRSEI